MAHKKATTSETGGDQDPPRDNEVSRDNILGGTGGDQAGAAPDEPGQADSTSESAPEDSDKKEPRRNRRIRRLTRQAARAQEELAAERAERERLERELAQLRAGKADAKPKLKDFDSDEEYAEAYAEWKASQGTTSEKPKKRKPAVSDTDIVNFVEQGRENFGREWDRAQAKADRNAFPLNEPMVEYLMDSDHGHAMFIALSKDPDLAKEIAVERGHGAVELLQELEREVAAKSEDDPEDTRERDRKGRFKKTKAPPPGPKKTRSGSSTPTDLFDDAPDMVDGTSRDLTAWMTARREHEDRRIGRHR